MRTLLLFSIATSWAVSAGMAAEPNPVSPAKTGYVKVCVEVEVRGDLARTDRTWLVTAVGKPGGAWADPTIFTLDFAAARGLRKSARKLVGREVVVRGRCELVQTAAPNPFPDGGGYTGFGPMPMGFPTRSWVLLRTIEVTALKSAEDD
jgi:hypothetical protein